MPQTIVDINEVTLKVIIDTGAFTDILDEAASQMINQTQTMQLEEDTCRIYAYGSQCRLTTLGKFSGKQTMSMIHMKFSRVHVGLS